MGRRLTSPALTELAEVCEPGPGGTALPAVRGDRQGLAVREEELAPRPGA